MRKYFVKENRRLIVRKGIGIAFRGLWEAGNTAILPQMGKIRPAARQQLMHIRLMTDVKHQAVSIRIKNSFDGNAQLYHTQIACQVSAGFRHAVNQKPANFVAKLAALIIIEAQKILVGVNSL